MKESVLTERINKKLEEHGIPRPFRELRLCLPEGRQFRADYCWILPEEKEIMSMINYPLISDLKMNLLELETVVSLIERARNNTTALNRWRNYEIKGKVTKSKITALLTKQELEFGEILNKSKGMNGVVLEADGKPFGGRHTRGAGFIQDSEKKNMISAKGFIVLNTTGSNLDGLMEIIKKCLKRI